MFGAFVVEDEESELSPASGCLVHGRPDVRQPEIINLVDGSVVEGRNRARRSTMRGRYALEFAGILRRRETQAVVSFWLSTSSFLTVLISSSRICSKVRIYIPADIRVKIW